MSDDKTVRLGDDPRVQHALDWWIGASAAAAIDKLLPIEVIGYLLSAADSRDPLRAEGTVCVRLDGLADKIAATFGFRPCGKWSTCSGGDNPTTRLDCSDDQCTNPEHKTRVPCTNRWHKIAGFVQSLAVQ